MSGDTDSESAPTTTLVAILIGLVLGVGIVVAATTYTPVSGEQPLQANSGATIVVDGASGLNLTQPFINDSAVFVETDSSGNLTVVGSGPASATVGANDITGSSTALTEIDTTQANLTINPEDKPAFTVGKEISTVTIQDSMALDDSTTDFSYSGPDGTTSLVDLNTVPGSTTIGAVDSSDGALLDVATSDASGQITFDQLDNSAHSVELHTSDGGPTVSNGSPDGTTVFTADPTLEIDLSDPDFPGDNVTLEWSVDGNTVATTTNITSSGTYSTTVTGLTDGSHDWQVTATDAYGNTDTSATRSFTVDHYDPDLSDPSPQGPQSTVPGNLSVDLSDADFAGDGDSVDVAFSLDGSSAGTVTGVSSNGTVSLQLPANGTTGGDHSWSATATDDYGGTDSVSASYSVPSTLTIYNESRPSEVLGNSTIGATFYYENGSEFTAVTKTTSNGVIILSGLPADKPLVINAEADGYRDRRIFVESIAETQSLFLLPDSEPFTTTMFELRDFTGDYPQDTTVLVVSRALNGTYQPVVGDYFGANSQFPAELAYNERHRLTLLNIETGETRPLGTFTPLSSGEQTLAVSVEGIIEVLDTDAQFDVDPTAERLPASNVTMAFDLQNGSSGNITQYNLTVTKQNASGTYTLVDVKRPTGGTVTRTLDLRNSANATLQVDVAYEVDGVATGQRSKTYAIVDHGNGGPTLLGSLSALVGQLPAGDRSAFTTTVAIIISLLSTATIASRVRVSSEMAGLVGVGWLTAFGILGWIGYDLLFVGIAAWLSLSALRRVLP